MTCARCTLDSRIRRVIPVRGLHFGYFAQYGEQHASALIGYLPYGAAAARKLEAERQRLMGYAKVMLAGRMGEADADSVDVVLAMKAAACELRVAGIGNGSWVSAAQGVTGNRALEVFCLVIDGELRAARLSASASRRCR